MPGIRKSTSIGRRATPGSLLMTRTLLSASSTLSSGASLVSVCVFGLYAQNVLLSKRTTETTVCSSLSKIDPLASCKSVVPIVVVGTLDNFSRVAKSCATPAPFVREEKPNGPKSVSSRKSSNVWASVIRIATRIVEPIRIFRFAAAVAS